MERVKSNLTSQRKVFIQRDYSKGTEIKFQTKFPQELEGLITPAAFNQFIETLNQMYQEAEQLNAKVCMESCVACLTAYITYLCFDTHFDKCMKKISAYIDEQNDMVFKPEGLYVIDPIERGLRVIEIVIQDPPANQAPKTRDIGDR